MKKLTPDDRKLLDLWCDLPYGAVQQSYPTATFAKIRRRVHSALGRAGYAPHTHAEVEAAREDWRRKKRAVGIFPDLARHHHRAGHL